MDRIVPFILVASLCAGCAGQRVSMERAVPQRSDAPATAWLRQIAPFPVRDAIGRPFGLPFLGGLNVPRPQLVDIDADGDLDLFVQEQTGDVIFFENTGTPQAARYVWRTDDFEHLDVGEWNRFVDLDGDGDFDLLAEQRFSYIKAFRNDGTPQKPHYVLATDSLKDADGKPLFADRQNIPQVTDIDCDGYLDLFVGRVEGTVKRYESTNHLGDGALPRFKLVADEFEDIRIIGQVMGSLHGANTMAFADYDGDGDRDLFWGDFFEPGLLLIENTGSCAGPSLRSEPRPFPPGDPLRTSGYNASTFADVDADGDLDLFVGVLGGAFTPNLTLADNFYFYEQGDDGAFTLRSRRYVDDVDVGSESIPAFADLDGDGDQDMLLANKIDPDDLGTSRTYVFENQGTPTAPSFQLTDTLALEKTFHHAPALADLDGDGDLDLLSGSWNDGLAFYRNEGTPQAPRFVLAASKYIQLTRGSNSTPALADLDADGDLDLFVGEASGTLNYYRNDGTPQEPHFTLVSDEFDEIDVGRRSFPVLVDLDGDGDYDLVVGTEAHGLILFRNTGTPQSPVFTRDDAYIWPPGIPAYATPAFVDVDGDGDLDLFSGGTGGGVVFFERVGGK